MRDALAAPRTDHDRVTIPVIWIAFALSILLHLAALIGWLPHMRILPFEGPERGNSGGSLTVELAPPPTKKPAPAPSVPRAAAPPPAPSAPAPKAAPKLPASPPVLARREPAPAAVSPTPPVASPSPVPPPAVPTPPAASDLSSYIEAQRRARVDASRPSPDGAPPVEQPVETERERHNRIVAAKLGLDNSPAIGYDPKAGGGIFQIQYVGVDEAEFVFFGWNKDIRRNSRQLIKVKRGDNPDIRIAMVRRMIAIIRENVSGDFVWISQRLRRDVTLSARPADNGGLEDFLMEEFFGDSRQAR
jgi:hypothetical protein